MSTGNLRKAMAAARLLLWASRRVKTQRLIAQGSSSNCRLLRTHEARQLCVVPVPFFVIS
jgi:hypothetical protein